MNLSERGETDPATAAGIPDVLGKLQRALGDQYARIDKLIDHENALRTKLAYLEQEKHLGGQVARVLKQLADAQVQSEQAKVSCRPGAWTSGHCNFTARLPTEPQKDICSKDKRICAVECFWYAKEYCLWSSCPTTTACLIQCHAASN